MAVFFIDWCGPAQTYVDPRETIHFWWYYYTIEGDDHLQYFVVKWKSANVKGWTDSSVKSVVVDKGNFFYDLAPYSLALDTVNVWKVEAWAVDKNFNPDPSVGASGVSGDPFLISETTMVIDCNGYTLWREANGTVASGAQDSRLISQIVSGWNTVPSDPGEYEARFRVSNGFQWSTYSGVVPLKQYDTRRMVKKSGIWQAVPTWKKTSGTMVEVQP